MAIESLAEMPEYQDGLVVRARLLLCRAFHKQEGGASPHLGKQVMKSTRNKNHKMKGMKYVQ